MNSARESLRVLRKRSNWSGFKSHTCKPLVSPKLATPSGKFVIVESDTISPKTLTGLRFPKSAPSRRHAHAQPALLGINWPTRSLKVEGNLNEAGNTRKGGGAGDRKANQPATTAQATSDSTKIRRERDDQAHLSMQREHRRNRRVARHCAATIYAHESHE